MDNQEIFSDFFMWLGPFKWPMIIIAAGVLTLIILKTIELFFIPNRTDSQKLKGINAILFWGSFQFILGIYAQVQGLWEALNEIIEAADISPVIVIIGFLGSFVTTMFGAGTLVVAALAWWGLRAKYRSGLADE